MQEPLNVLVLAASTGAIVARFKAISPRLRVTRQVVTSIDDVAPDLLAATDILYTSGTLLPTPENAPRLRWVQSQHAGVERLLTQPLFASGEVILTTASGVHATTIAEHTLAFMLAFTRKVPTMLRHQQQAAWPADAIDIYQPPVLRNATIGIIGYGSIGREIGRLAKAFGMHVLATKRDMRQTTAVNEYAPPGVGDPDGLAVDQFYAPDAIVSMVARCDFVVVALPATAETVKIIDRNVLSAMKPAAILINVGRGTAVDEPALIEALESGRLGGAGLDVFAQEPLPPASPLWRMDNVIISPHISGNTNRYAEDTAELFAANLHRYINNQELLNRVDRTRGY